MKLFTKILAVIVVAASATVSAQAQFKWGVKAGVAINELKFDKGALDSDNRAGFTGGLMADFTVPVIGVGFDASVLYAARSVKFDNQSKTRSYIDIPINFKYKIGLPVVGNIVSPFLTTGPDFSFLLSKSRIDEVWKNRKFDFAWNVGAGVQLVNRVQIAASYGFGLTKSMSDESLNSSKNRCWTVTAAYLF